MEQYLTPEMMNMLVAWAVRVIGALIVLAVGWSFAGWARRTVEKRLSASKLDDTLTRFFASLTRILLLVLVVLTTLRIFGVDTTSFAAVLAAAGFAVGLALQGSLSNFSAGVMLLAFRPFKAGQAVRIGGELGLVHSIDLFTTQLDTFDNRRIIMPNSEVFGGSIENISHHPTRRVDVAVGTDYGADLDQTRRILQQAGEGIKDRLADKDVDVILGGLGASSIDWEVRVWVESANFLAVKQQLTRDVKVALDNAGIGIPFPQMDVHLDKPAAD